MAKFYPHFRLAGKIGGHEFEWQVSSVRELVSRAEQEFGAAFSEEFKKAAVTVNGRAINFLNGLDTALTDSDVVYTQLLSSEF